MTRGRSKIRTVGKTSKIEHPWKFTSIEELFHYLNKYIEAGKMTLVMSQADYDSFSDALDYSSSENESYFANFFRPITDQTDRCKLDWVFAGMVQLKIKIEN